MKKVLGILLLATSMTSSLLHAGIKNGEWFYTLQEGKTILGVGNFFYTDNQQIRGWQVTTEDLRVNRVVGNITDHGDRIFFGVRDRGVDNRIKGTIRAEHTNFGATLKDGNTVQAKYTTGRLKSSGSYFGYDSFSNPVLLIIEPQGKATFFISTGYKAATKCYGVASTRSVKVKNTNRDVEFLIKIRANVLHGEGKVNGQSVRIFGRYIDERARELGIRNPFPDNKGEGE